MSFPGSHGGSGYGLGYLLGEPGEAARFGLVVVGVLLLLTLARRRTLKGALQIILIACLLALPLIPGGDKNGLVYYVPHIVIAFAVLSFVVGRVNEDT